MCLYVIKSYKNSRHYVCVCIYEYVDAYIHIKYSYIRFNVYSLVVGGGGRKKNRIKKQSNSNVKQIHVIIFILQFSPSNSYIYSRALGGVGHVYRYFYFPSISSSSVLSVTLFKFLDPYIFLYFFGLSPLVLIFLCATF